jgi:hypothetical protein
MSMNIDQVFIANPITSNASTDLMYFGQSPYGAGNDAAMTYANFSAQFGAPYTPSALTKSDDTNVTLTLGGTPAMALLHAASITVGWTGTLAVGRGGLGISSTPSNGQIPIGDGTNYTAATLTAGTGVSITNGVGTISIASSGASPWVDQTTSSVTMAVNTGYTSDAGASLITFTLPATSAIGDWVEINGKGAGGWTIAQATGQLIHVGNLASTSGGGGSVASTNQFDCIRLRCLTANTIWTTVSGVGNFTVV